MFMNALRKHPLRARAKGKIEFQPKIGAPDRKIRRNDSLPFGISLSNFRRIRRP
jgi:hypothetical protein